MAVLAAYRLLTAPYQLRTPFFGLRDTPVTPQEMFDFPLFVLGLSLEAALVSLWFYGFYGSLCFYVFMFFYVLLASGFFIRLFFYMAGAARPRQALAGSGRPWQV